MKDITPLDIVLELQSIPSSANSKLFIMSVSVTVAEFELTFVRYKDSTWKTAKEIIKASISQIPSTSVPLIDKLDQPFDEAYFVYVQDAAFTNPGGVKKGELTLLKDVFGDTAPLLFKPTKANTLDTDFVITPGLHFHLVVNESTGPTVVLDHLFGAAQNNKGTRSLTSPATSQGDSEENSSDSATPVTDDSASTVSKPIGRSLSNGLRRREGLSEKELSQRTLKIHLSTARSLSPLEMITYPPIHLSKTAADPCRLLFVGSHCYKSEHATDSWTAINLQYWFAV